MGSEGGGGGDLISAGIDLYGADARSAAVEEQIKFKKDEAEFNSKLTAIKRKEVMKQADRDVVARGKELSGLLGSQRVNLAAQGIDIEGDTAILIQNETRDIAAEEFRAIQNNAWNASYGLKLEDQLSQRQLRFEVRAARAEAKTSLVTAGLKIGVSAAKTGVKGF